MSGKFRSLITLYTNFHIPAFIKRIAFSKMTNTFFYRK